MRKKQEDIEQLKVIVQEVYDQLLGKGAYEQIYAKMANISFVAGVLINVITQLSEEVDKRMIPTSSKVKVATKKPAKKQTKK